MVSLSNHDRLTFIVMTIMKTIDTFSSLFLILLGILFSVGSFRLGIGAVNAPGPGLIPLGTGALLILFSLATIVEARLGKRVEEKDPLFKGKRWGVALSVLIALFAYVLVLDILGFMITTFLTMTILFKISEKQKWKTALGVSGLTTASAYFLFDYLLKCSFPRGFLGF
jgi:putative tricarboxylic transport membrane protein